MIKYNCEDTNCLPNFIYDKYKLTLLSMNMENILHIQNKSVRTPVLVGLRLRPCIYVASAYRVHKLSQNNIQKHDKCQIYMINVFVFKIDDISF